MTAARWARLECLLRIGVSAAAVLDITCNLILIGYVFINLPPNIQETSSHPLFVGWCLYGGIATLGSLVVSGLLLLTFAGKKLAGSPVRIWGFISLICGVRLLGATVIALGLETAHAWIIWSPGVAVVICFVVGVLLVIRSPLPLSWLAAAGTIVFAGLAIYAYRLVVLPPFSVLGGIGRGILPANILVSAVCPTLGALCIRMSERT